MDCVDVCVNYYGKPYQTAVTLKTLWNNSKQHIGTIFVVIEKTQPHNQYGSVALLQYLLRDLPIEYYYPKYFYYHGTPPEELLNDPDIRYGLKYQYAFEKTDKRYLYLTHNDCLYQDDLLGKMLDRIKQDGQTVMGIGMIGQCWNCPALAANLCDGSRFESFRPSAEQALALVDQYKPPRAEIHYNLLQRGYLHPMPECRLNEYACLINADIYKEVVKPTGNILPMGGSWHGTDWGAIWFHDLYNLGYRFINFPFEPHMLHAPFSPHKSGHKGDKDNSEYFQTEELAHQYLKEKLKEDTTIPFNIKVQMTQYSLTQMTKTGIAKAVGKVKWLLADK